MSRLGVLPAAPSPAPATPRFRPASGGRDSAAFGVPRPVLLRPGYRPRDVLGGRARARRAPSSRDDVDDAAPSPPPPRLPRTRHARRRPAHPRVLLRRAQHLEEAQRRHDRAVRDGVRRRPGGPHRQQVVQHVRVQGQQRVRRLRALPHARGRQARPMAPPRNVTKILGVEICPDAVPIETHPFDGPCAFICGNEGEGMTEQQKAMKTGLTYEDAPTRPGHRVAQRRRHGVDRHAPLLDVGEVPGEGTRGGEVRRRGAAAEDAQEGGRWGKTRRR